MNTKAKDALQIFILVVGMSFVTFFLYYFRFNKEAKIITGLVGCIYYSIWGIIHHASKERLTMHVVLEYLLVGLVVFLLLLIAFTF